VSKIGYRKRSGMTISSSSQRKQNCRASK